MQHIPILHNDFNWNTQLSTFIGTLVSPALHIFFGKLNILMKQHTLYFQTGDFSEPRGGDVKNQEFEILNKIVLTVINKF